MKRKEVEEDKFEGEKRREVMVRGHVLQDKPNGISHGMNRVTPVFLGITPKGAPVRTIPRQKIGPSLICFACFFYLLSQTAEFTELRK